MQPYDTSYITGFYLISRWIFSSLSHEYKHTNSLFLPLIEVDLIASTFNEECFAQAHTSNPAGRYGTGNPTTLFVIFESQVDDPVANTANFQWFR